jgi:hypothetical protein
MRRRAPEDAELSDIIEALISAAGEDFAEWLRNRGNARKVPHRMESVGYVPVRNKGAKDDLWKIGGRRQAVYARKELSLSDQMAAALELAGH